jgi:uncharacterized protein
VRKSVALFLLAAVCSLNVSAWMLASAGDTRVADAAMQNDLEAVRALLKQAVDANSSQGDGMTALHWAAMNGNAEMAQLLIYAGATIKPATRLGSYTPLYLAAQRGNAKVAEVLLKAGADAKGVTLGGVTPLMMAASSGDTETIKTLLEYGAEVNGRETVNGQTAMAFAAAFNRADAVRILARYGAELDHRSNVIKRQQDPLADRNGPPAPAATGQRGQPAAGATGQAPAAAQPQTATAQPGQVPPAQPQPAVPPPQQGQGQQAANAPRDPTRPGGNPKGQLTPLMYAARQGNMEAAVALLDVGARINEVSADGSTALLLAVINGRFDLARLFVERGADVNIASVDGTAPLYGLFNIQWAWKTLHPQPTTKYEKTHYLDLAKLMLDKGADPNARLKKDLWYNGFGFALDSTNATGATPFWKCAAVADVDGMKLLVSRGADPSVKNIDNITALLAASGAGFHGNDDVITPNGRMAAVRYLVDELHADVNAVDGRAETPASPAAAAPARTAAAPQPANPQPPAAGQPAAPIPPQQMNFAARNPPGGFSALHNAAHRGDNEMILFLIARGARVDVVARNGNTIVDMANGPRQRVQPFAETIALLEALGAKNSYKCVSC